MKNPYSELDVVESTVSFDRRVAWGLAILFLVGIVGVPLLRHVLEFRKPKMERWLPVVEFWRKDNEKTYNQFFEKKSKNPSITRDVPNLRDHLQAFEAGIKESGFRNNIQKEEQRYLSGLFKSGNRKVVQGKEGWLYFRPAIESLTGRGPLEVEPDSVTKDPDRANWLEPLPVITGFAKQLEARGIKLMLVPIPVKPMIETEGLGLEPANFQHADEARFYSKLENAGIEVVDLRAAFLAFKAEGNQVFLKQDTHWTPDTARIAAEVVSERIQEMDWYRSAEKYPELTMTLAEERYGRGDLVGMLGLPENFKDEAVRLPRVIDPETNRSVEGDLLSPISILGDSFTNIYEEAGLGFGAPSDQGLIGGGFGSYLSMFLKMRPHVVAINGEGATGVRKAFAALPDNVVRSRKLVVWAIASRDLLLAETAANRAGVYWRPVEFNPQTEPMGSQPADDNDGHILMLSGVLKEKSVIEDPNKTAYSEALYTALFDQIEVESGEYYDAEAMVHLWAFQERKLLPSAKIEVGKRYRLKLVPLVTRPDLTRKKQLSDLIRFDLDPHYAEEVVEVEK